MEDLAMSNQVDVLVIGSGGAGLSAAISAREEGAKVLILEAEPSIGGSTVRSAGVLVAAGTSVQQALGVPDTPEDMYQHYMDLNQWKVLPGPVWKFCQQSAEMFEWLLDIGVEVPAQHSTNAHMPGLTRGGVENNKRCHVPKGQGKGLIAALDRRRQDLGIEVRTQARVNDLIIKEGRVRGVLVGKERIDAKSVIVAAGGFARNQDLLRKYFPDALDAGTDFFAVAADGSRGDHLRFAEKHGLKIFGHNWGLLLLTARFQRFHHWVSGFPPASRIYVDATGTRCMDEDSTYAVNQGQWKAAGKLVWAIFDERARTDLPRDVEDWQPDRILEEVSEGVVHQASTISELAEKIGVPETNLKFSIDRWNSLLPQGFDEDFRRDETLRMKGVEPKLPPIEQSPFYAVQIVPGELVCTHTGLQINSEAEVLLNSGKQVEGLYAAGESAGGVLGERYVGAGNSVTNGLVLGRLAGKNASSK